MITDIFVLVGLLGTLGLHGHTYTFFKGALSWDDAKKGKFQKLFKETNFVLKNINIACEKHGTTLAVIQTLQEHIAAVETIRKASNSERIRVRKKFE